MFECAACAGRWARPHEGERGTTEVKEAQSKLQSNLLSSRASDGSVCSYTTREEAVNVLIQMKNSRGLRRHHSRTAGTKGDSTRRRNVGLGFERPVGFENSTSAFMSNYYVTGCVIHVVTTAFLLQRGGTKEKGVRSVGWTVMVGRGHSRSPL